MLHLHGRRLRLQGKAEAAQVRHKLRRTAGRHSRVDLVEGTHMQVQPAAGNRAGSRFQDCHTARLKEASNLVVVVDWVLGQGFQADPGPHPHDHTVGHREKGEMARSVCWTLLLVAVSEKF